MMHYADMAAIHQCCEEINMFVVNLIRVALKVSQWHNAICFLCQSSLDV